MSDNNLTDSEVLRQLDEANRYRDIIIDVMPRITQDAADDMSLRIRDYAAAQLAERDAEIERLQAQVETMLQAQAYAENTILRQRWKMDAQKRTASDAIAERDASIARMEKQLSGNLDAETNERIAQIMSRWTVSTPGEWITTADSPDSAYYDEVVAVHNQDDPDYGTMSHVLTVPELDDRPNDLIFAACAHQDIPFLVGVISEFSGRYTTLRRHVDYLNDVHDRAREFSRERTGEMAADIKELHAQVAELQAWKDVVPVDAMRRYWATVYANKPDYSGKYDDMSKVQDFLLSAFDSPQEYPD